MMEHEHVFFFGRGVFCCCSCPFCCRDDARDAAGVGVSELLYVFVSSLIHRVRRRGGENGCSVRQRSCLDVSKTTLSTSRTFCRLERSSPVVLRGLDVG